MKCSFSQVTILYNPKSTGDSKKQAVSLKNELQKMYSELSVSLKATAYAGHAESIGAQYAKEDKNTLLVISSGDGGYNELVNGVLSKNTKHLTVAVIPSGNANDHAASTGLRTLTERMQDGTTLIDVLRVDARVAGKQWNRHAHSYVGIGMTAYIGEKLTKADLNPLNEKWLIVKYLLQFKHATLRLGDKNKFQRFSSIVFGNIDRMSKVVQLDKTAKINDGKFEIYINREKTMLKLLSLIARASTIGLERQAQAKKFRLECKSKEQIQCDGEVFEIDPGTVVVTSIRQRLRVLKE